MSRVALRLDWWLLFGWLDRYIAGLDPRSPLLDQWTLAQFYGNVATGDFAVRDEARLECVSRELG